jgi:hypothetical protein
VVFRLRPAHARSPLITVLTIRPLSQKEESAGPVAVQADQVERDGGEHVLQVSLRHSSVAGLADACDGDGLVDAALHTGASRVACLPIVFGLFGASCGLGFVCLARQDAQLAAIPPEGR